MTARIADWLVTHGATALRVSAERLESLVWLGVLGFLAFSVSATATELVRGDPVYLCRYGRDCSTNSWAKRCCRHLELPNATAVYSCAAKCD
jgi:hypothetical protein